MILDKHPILYSMPIHITLHRPRFEVPSTPPARRPTLTSLDTHRQARAPTSNGVSGWAAYNTARFADEELQESQSSTFVASRWTGKDRQGILGWARGVWPGLEADCAPPAIEASSTDPDRRLTRPHPFPVTPPNVAPPCVTMVPRHALLCHTSMHCRPHPVHPTSPSPMQDDNPFLTPVDSVITPSRPRKTESPKSKLGVGSLLSKVYSWIASPPRDLHTCPDVDPTPPSAGDCVAAHPDDAPRCSRSPSVRPPVSLMSPTDTRPRMTNLGSDPL
jgi:hypothetical protein